MYVRSKSFERAVAYPVKVNMRTSLTFLLHILALKFKAGSNLISIHVLPFKNQVLCKCCTHVIF